MVSGAVRIQKLLEGGRLQVVAFNFPGDIFGLELRSPRAVSAHAVTAAQLLVLRRNTLEDIATRDIDVTRHLLALTARSLDHAWENILLLGRKSAGERVAAFLLEMRRRMGPAGLVDLPMSRFDIADYLGLTVETVSRVIHIFKK